MRFSNFVLKALVSLVNLRHAIRIVRFWRSMAAALVTALPRMDAFVVANRSAWIVRIGLDGHFTTKQRVVRSRRASGSSSEPQQPSLQSSVARGRKAP